MQRNGQHLLTWKLLTCSSKGRNLFTSERREETVAVASLSAAELSVLSCSVAKSCNKTKTQIVLRYFGVSDKSVPTSLRLLDLWSRNML